MRYQLLCLLFAVGTANAATLEVEVSQGSHESEPVSYTHLTLPTTPYV